MTGGFRGGSSAEGAPPVSPTVDPPLVAGRGSALRWWARKSVAAVAGYGMAALAAPWILAYVAFVAITAPVGAATKGGKPCSSSRE